MLSTCSRNESVCHVVINHNVSIQLSSLSLRVILWDAKKSKNMTFRGEVSNGNQKLSRINRRRVHTHTAQDTVSIMTVNKHFVK